jgi:copper chaperone CopZ
MTIRSVVVAWVSFALVVSLALALTGCATSDATTTGGTDSHGASPALLADGTPVSGSGSLLWVRGMSCPKCVSNVDLQLKRLPGVDRVAINMGLGTVSVTYAGAERPMKRQLAEAVDNAALTLLRIEEVP